MSAASALRAEPHDSGRTFPQNLHAEKKSFAFSLHFIYFHKTPKRDNFFENIEKNFSRISHAKDFFHPRQKRAEHIAAKRKKMPAQKGQNPSAQDLAPAAAPAKTAVRLSTCPKTPERLPPVRQRPGTGRRRSLQKVCKRQYLRTLRDRFFLSRHRTYC